MDVTAHLYAQIKQFVDESKREHFARRTCNRANRFQRRRFLHCRNTKTLRQRPAFTGARSSSRQRFASL